MGSVWGALGSLNLDLEATPRRGKREFAGKSSWPGQDSNLRATDYESAALPLSYRAGNGERRYHRPGWWRRVPVRCWPVSDSAPIALASTLALLATFLGIGVLVNLLIFYVIAQVMGERKQNREYRAGEE